MSTKFVFHYQSPRATAPNCNSIAALFEKGKQRAIAANPEHDHPPPIDWNMVVEDDVLYDKAVWTMISYIGWCSVSTRQLTANDVDGIATTLRDNGRFMMLRRTLACMMIRFRREFPLCRNLVKEELAQLIAMGHDTNFPGWIDNGLLKYLIDNELQKESITSMLHIL
jgi:hypothetical protein